VHPKTNAASLMAEKGLSDHAFVLFRDVVFTEDLKEGLASFRERRSADFKGL
jgi:hypothetical protein